MNLAEGVCGEEGPLMTEICLWEEKILNQTLEGGGLGRVEGVGGLAVQASGKHAEPQACAVGGAATQGLRAPPASSGRPHPPRGQNEQVSGLWFGAAGPSWATWPLLNLRTLGSF